MRAIGVAIRPNRCINSLATRCQGEGHVVVVVRRWRGEGRREGEKEIARKKGEGRNKRLK